MKKGLIIIILIILTLGVIGGNVSDRLATMLLGLLISSLGIFNLVIWYIIKCTFIVNKAYLLNVTRLPSRAGGHRAGGGSIATIQYNFNEKEYITKISVGDNSLFANKCNIGKELNIYMSEKYPKIVVDKIQNNSTIYAISIVLFILGLFLVL